jgi:hypothetical protein
MEKRTRKTHRPLDSSALKSVASSYGFYVAQTKRTGHFDPLHDSHLRFVHPFVNNFALDVWPHNGTTKLMRLRAGEVTVVNEPGAVRHDQSLEDIGAQLAEMRNIPDIDSTFYS